MNAQQMKNRRLAIQSGADKKHDFGTIVNERENRLIANGLYETTDPFFNNQLVDEDVAVQQAIHTVNNLTGGNNYKPVEQFAHGSQYKETYQNHQIINHNGVTFDVKGMSILKNPSSYDPAKSKDFTNYKDAVDLIKTFDIQNNSAFIIDATSIKFLEILKKGNKVDAECKSGFFSTDCTQFRIYIIDCLETRNDPAFKNLYDKSLLNNDFGVELVYIEPSDPQVVTYKYNPNNDNPEDSWFSRYIFKLMASDMEGNGCRLIMGDSDNLNEVEILDPKNGNSISTIVSFIKKLKWPKLTGSLGPTDQKKFNYKIQQKRSGDWLQVLACKRAKNMNWRLVKGYKKLQQENMIPKLPQGDSFQIEGNIYFVTHDRVALGFAIEEGVDTLFTHGYSQTIMSFITPKTIEQRVHNAGLELDRLIAELRTYTDKDIVPENINGMKGEVSQKLAGKRTEINKYRINTPDILCNVFNTKDVGLIITTFNQYVRNVFSQLTTTNKQYKICQEMIHIYQSIEKINDSIKEYRIVVINEEPNDKYNKLVVNIDVVKKQISICELMNKLDYLITNTVLGPDIEVGTINFETYVNKYFRNISMRNRKVDLSIDAFNYLYSIDDVAVLNNHLYEIRKCFQEVIGYLNNDDCVIAITDSNVIAKERDKIKYKLLIIAFCEEVIQILDEQYQKYLDNQDLYNEFLLGSVVIPAEIPINPEIGIDQEKQMKYDTLRCLQTKVDEIRDIQPRLTERLMPPQPNLHNGDETMTGGAGENYNIEFDRRLDKIMKYNFPNNVSNNDYNNLHACTVLLHQVVNDEKENDKSLDYDLQRYLFHRINRDAIIEQHLKKEPYFVETQIQTAGADESKIGDPSPNKKFKAEIPEVQRTPPEKGIVTPPGTNPSITASYSGSRRNVKSIGADVLTPSTTQASESQNPIIFSTGPDSSSDEMYSKSDAESDVESNIELPSAVGTASPSESGVNLLTDAAAESGYNLLANVVELRYNKQEFIAAIIDKISNLIGHIIYTEGLNNLYNDPPPRTRGWTMGGAPHQEPQQEAPQGGQSEEIESIGHLYKHNRGCRVKASNSPTEVFETIVKMSSPTFENEQRILSKLSDVPFSSVLFPTIMKKEDITLGSIEDDEMKRCMENPETPYMMITRRSKGVPITEYFEELDQQENPQLTLVQLLESFIQGLKMLSSLEQHSIVHMDINENTVTYDKMNGTLALADFSMSFDKEDNNTTDEETFVEYDGELYWSMEVYILSMITKLEPEARQQVPTKEELDAMCMSYAEESSLKTVVDESTMAQYIEIMKTYMEDTTTGQTWEQMKASLKEGMFKWDLFSLIVLCLRIMVSLSIRDSEVIHELEQQLREYIITRPNMMKTPKEIEEEIREKFGSVEKERIEQMKSTQEEIPQQDLTQDPPQDPQQDPQEDLTQDPQEDLTQDPQQEPPQDPQQDPQQEPPQDLTQDLQQKEVFQEEISKKVGGDDVEEYDVKRMVENANESINKEKCFICKIKDSEQKGWLGKLIKVISVGQGGFLTFKRENSENSRIFSVQYSLDRNVVIGGNSEEYEAIFESIDCEKRAVWNKPPRVVAGGKK